MKLSEMTLQEVIILILFVGLLFLGIDHMMLRKDFGFDKRMDEFKAWQVQATNIINNIAARLPNASTPIPPVPQPKEGKK